MKKFIRTGATMLAVSLVLTSATAWFMQAHAAGTQTAAVASEVRPMEQQVLNVVMNGPVDLVLRQAAQAELLVRGDAKLVPRVTTKVEGNTLYVSTRGLFIAIGQSDQTRVELALPAIEKVQLSGSGNGNIRGFKAKQIELILKGSGDLNIDGDFQRVQALLGGSGNLNLGLPNGDTIDLSMQGSGDAILKGQSRVLILKSMGSGDLNATALKASQAQLQQQGSGDVKAWVSEDIKIKLSGSGDAIISGNPGKRSVDRTGSGDIIWK